LDVAADEIIILGKREGEIVVFYLQIKTILSLVDVPGVKCY